jgi:hypothetical protein
MKNPQKISTGGINKTKIAKLNLSASLAAFGEPVIAFLHIAH